MLMKLRAENPYNEMSGMITLAQATPDQTEWTIGRSIDCDITLNEVDISREHARIQLIEGEFFFVDHSSNGSSVNGVPIATNVKYPLKQGDRLGIGNTSLTVEELTVSPPQTTANSSQSVQYWTDQELTLRCFRIAAETSDTKTFSFIGQPPVLFHYLPGQFVNLEFEIDGKPIVRPYSISSSPSSPYALSITVKRVPNGIVSNWLNAHLRVGDAVRVLPGGARGKFTCLPQVPPKLLFLAAGSGITPLMSMLRWIYDTGTEQLTDILLLYSVRTADDLIFRQELEMMAARMARCRVVFTLTSPQSGEGWSGLTGRISEELIKLVVPDVLERSVFVCGPTAFMQTSKGLLQALQFPIDTHYQQESFGERPAPAKAPPRDHGNGHPATVILSAPSTPAAGELTVDEQAIATNSTDHQSSSVSVEPTSPTKENQTAATPASTPMVVFPNGQQIEADEALTLLELAELAGVTLKSGCGAGVCSTCKIRIAKGQVRHEPEDPSEVTLSPGDRAAGYVLACIAHPVGHVELAAEF